MKALQATSLTASRTRSFAQPDNPRANSAPGVTDSAHSVRDDANSAKDQGRVAEELTEGPGDRERPNPHSHSPLCPLSPTGHEAFAIFCPYLRGDFSRAFSEFLEDSIVATRDSELRP